LLLFFQEVLLACWAPWFLEPFYISHWFPWIENLSLMSHCSSFKGMKQIDIYYVCHQSGTFSHFSC
jgi:hypothetical protein